DRVSFVRRLRNVRARLPHASRTRTRRARCARSPPPVGGISREYRAGCRPGGVRSVLRSWPLSCRRVAGFARLAPLAAAGLNRLARFGIAGKREHGRGTLARFAFQIEIAAMLACEAACDGQAEPRAFLGARQMRLDLAE